MLSRILRCEEPGRHFFLFSRSLDGLFPNNDCSFFRSIFLVQALIYFWVFLFIFEITSKTFIHGKMHPILFWKYNHCDALHAHVHIFSTNSYMHASANLCLYIHRVQCVHVYVCMCMYIRCDQCVYVYMCICMYVHTSCSMCACIRVHMYVYTLCSMRECAELSQRWSLQQQLISFAMR